MSKTAAIALLGLVAMAPARAEGPERIDKPVAQVGTSWRTRVSDGMTKVLISETQYRISAVSASEVEVSDDSGQVTLVLDATNYALKRSGERVFEPALQRLRFPVAVGDRWEAAYRYNNPQCGPTQSKLSFKAVAWEDISVPAGKMRALRVESEGQWRSGCGNDRQTHKHWYVPEVGVPVRQEDVYYFQGRIFSSEVQELMELRRP